MVKDNRLKWDKYHMGLAIGISTRSTCEKNKVGANITQNNKIMGTGYNGSPSKNFENCSDVGCAKDKAGISDSLGSGKCVAAHAEMNALNYISGNQNNLTSYSTVFSCFDCAIEMIQSGITKIFYKKNYDGREAKATIDFLHASGIEVNRLNLDMYDILNMSNPYFHQKNGKGLEEIFQGEDILLEQELGNRADWSEYFIMNAILASSRSSCRNFVVGSIITNGKNRIIGTGYKGAASTIKDNCLKASCRKKEIGFCYGIDSESNALRNRISQEVEGGTLYSTNFPNSMKTIKNLSRFGLKEIVFSDVQIKEEDLENSLKFLQKMGIKTTYLNLSQERFLDIVFAPDKNFKIDIWTPKEKEKIGTIIKNHKFSI